MNAALKLRFVLILNTLTPVFLLIAIGVVLQRSGFVSEGFLREANRLTYWLGLPALLFSQLVSAMHGTSAAQAILMAQLTATGVVIGLAYLAAVLLRVPGSGAGTFVQAGFRGNLAFVGLPIIYAMPDATLPGGMSIRTAAVLTVAPMMVVYNVAGVVVLLLSQHPIHVRMIPPFVKQLATTPPLLAALAGLVFVLMDWTLPASLDKTFNALGEMALPLGLLGVGGSIVTVKFGRNWHVPLAAALVKTALSPLIGWLVGRWFGLDPLALKMVMIFMATPSAVVSYTMALEMKGDGGLASGAIVMSVLTSVVTLAVILAI